MLRDGFTWQQEANPRKQRAANEAYKDAQRKVGQARERLMKAMEAKDAADAAFGGDIASVDNPATKKIEAEIKAAQENLDRCLKLEAEAKKLVDHLLAEADDLAQEWKAHNIDSQQKAHKAHMEGWYKSESKAKIKRARLAEKKRQKKIKIRNHERKKAEEKQRKLNSWFFEQVKGDINCAVIAPALALFFIKFPDYVREGPLSDFHRDALVQLAKEVHDQLPGIRSGKEVLNSMSRFNIPPAAVGSQSGRGNMGHLYTVHPNGKVADVQIEAGSLVISYEDNVDGPNNIVPTLIYGARCIKCDENVSKPDLVGGADHICAICGPIVSAGPGRGTLGETPESTFPKPSYKSGPQSMSDGELMQPKKTRQERAREKIQLYVQSFKETLAESITVKPSRKRQADPDAPILRCFRLRPTVLTKDLASLADSTATFARVLTESRKLPIEEIVYFDDRHQIKHPVDYVYEKMGDAVYYAAVAMDGVGSVGEETCIGFMGACDGKTAVEMEARILDDSTPRRTTWKLFASDIIPNQRDSGVAPVLEDGSSFPPNSLSVVSIPPCCYSPGGTRQLFEASYKTLVDGGKLIIGCCSSQIKNMALVAVLCKESFGIDELDLFEPYDEKTRTPAAVLTVTKVRQT